METITLNGVTYTLNQCEDVWLWLATAKVGEFTRYYDKTIFAQEGGCFYAAYSNDLTNGVYV